MPLRQARIGLIKEPASVILVVYVEGFEELGVRLGAEDVRELVKGLEESLPALASAGNYH